MMAMPTSMALVWKWMFVTASANSAMPMNSTGIAHNQPFRRKSKPNSVNSDHGQSAHIMDIKTMMSALKNEAESDMCWLAMIQWPGNT